MARMLAALPGPRAIMLCVAASSCCWQVPEGFTLSAMQHLLLYLYTDELQPGLEPSRVVELLHVAAYYGTPR